MDIAGFIVLGIFAVSVAYLVLVYNSLVQIKHDVAKAWSNIDVLLKQRHDELPKLVETCKQYMKYEQETLEKVMRARDGVAAARTSHDVKALGTAEAGMRGALGRLFALAEAYPELKANQTFAHLQGRISGLENGIADRREFYNESVNINNVRIEQFPDLIVARLMNFHSFDVLDFDAQETRDVNLQHLFG
ncbi:MAG: LemA family protein [Burkholderiales bacterium]